MNRTVEVIVKKTVYKESDKDVTRKALQDIAEMFTASELLAIAKKLKSPIVQMQIRSML